MNLIQCHDLIELAQVCAELTRQGCAYKADTATLRITITGY